MNARAAGFDVVVPVLQHQGDIDFYDLLGAALRERGARVLLLPLSRDGLVQLRARHPDVQHLYEGLDRDLPAPPGQVERITRRYHLHNIKDFVFPECLYYGETPERAIRRTLHIFLQLERVIERHGVGIFLNNVGPEIARRVMSAFGRAGGPPNVIIDFAPFHGRGVLTTDEVEWDELPAIPPPIDQAARLRVEALVAEVTSRKRMFSKPAKLGMNVGSVVRPLVNLVKQRLGDDGQADASLAFIYGQRLRHLARRGANRWFYQAPVEGEQYLFFPLHVPDDSAITVRAPQYQHQEALIELIARRALPPGMKLYVKPHPAGVDYYPVGMLARIARTPDVRLIHPHVHSHDLIRGSRAQVVINSTVGFESLFYFQPVVLLGRVFYRGRGATVDVESPADLPAAVERALLDPPDRESILRLLAACEGATMPAVWNDRSPANIARLADEILAKGRRLGRLTAPSAPGASPAPPVAPISQEGHA